MIKKISLFIVLGVLGLSLSACTMDKSKVKEYGQENNKINSDLINDTINNSINQNDMRTLEGQKDLAAEYSGAIMSTSLGDITFKFYDTESPVTVNNFMNLAQDGFYDNTKFHRVIKDFMIQGGDPNSKGDNTATYGTGSPGYQFGDEFNNHKLVQGSLAMANSGPNTNGSQFFIVSTSATPHLDGVHTNFGYVLEGMDVVHQIEDTEVGPRDLPITPIVINSIKLVK